MMFRNKLKGPSRFYHAFRGVPKEDRHRWQSLPFSGSLRLMKPPQDWSPFADRRAPPGLLIPNQVSNITHPDRFRAEQKSGSMRWRVILAKLYHGTPGGCSEIAFISDGLMALSRK